MSLPVACYRANEEILRDRNGERAAPLWAVINASGAGANTVIAAVPNRQIVVLQYAMMCAVATAATWQSTLGTVLGGPLPFAANGGISAPYVPIGHFEVPLGEGLDLFLGGANQVSGHLRYVVV